MSRNQFENNEDPVESSEVELKVDGRVVGYGVYDPETGVIQGAFTTEEVWIDPEDHSVSFGVKKAEDPADRYRVKDLPKYGRPPQQ